MSKTPWKPWRDVVSLREDVRSGELSLKIFAADLYDVVMDRGTTRLSRPCRVLRPHLSHLCAAGAGARRDARLAGQSDKAIRQLELTYGGGKTHTLITMYHLANDPDALPDLPAVEEFIAAYRDRPSMPASPCWPSTSWMSRRAWRSADRTAPARWLRQPWSVLAYQIAGNEGLRLLHAEGEDAERESPPAENLLVDLLALPARDGLATLILIDEVLMYAREKVGHDPAWKDRLALLPVPDPGRRQGGSLRDRGLAAGHRPRQERRLWAGRSC